MNIHVGKGKMKTNLHPKIFLILSYCRSYLLTRVIVMFIYHCHLKQFYIEGPMQSSLIMLIKGCQLVKMCCENRICPSSKPFCQN